jgi:hypothetical protein
MASTTSSTTGFFSSPRAQRALYWVSGIVFLAGVVAIITVYATRGGSNASSPSQVNPNPPSQTSNRGTSTKKVKASPEALGVARKFLETAVVRKNLAESYNLVGPYLKGGATLKQWTSGNNTVVPYPANNTKTTALIVKTSHPTDLLIWVSLVPRPGAGVKPQMFSIELDKLKGHWLVNGFQPLYQPGVQNGSGQS